VFKNILIAAILLGVVAFAALAFRPGSVGTIGQGGGSSSWGSDNGGGGNWGGDDDDD